jgi:anaerobic selenocysteine-containing dehydrogenase
MSDRYRGVYGQRDVVFLNKSELEKRGLRDGDRVDLVTKSTDGIERRVGNLRAVGYSFPDGCCAAYYPETNPLIPLYAHDPLSFTPSSKAIPIRIERTHTNREGSCSNERV